MCHNYDFFPQNDEKQSQNFDNFLIIYLFICMFLFGGNVFP